mmetsp:Transcript_29066/g.66856  ORF Transcript_29066/g.66856 Transcript_29066/m.66856 type:complete len:225 (+) Transcript_29066:53-727(+)
MITMRSSIQVSTRNWLGGASGSAPCKGPGRAVKFRCTTPSIAIHGQIGTNMPSPAHFCTHGKFTRAAAREELLAPAHCCQACCRHKTTPRPFQTARQTLRKWHRLHPLRWKARCRRMWCHPPQTLHCLGASSHPRIREALDHQPHSAKKTCQDMGGPSFLLQAAVSTDHALPLQAPSLCDEPALHWPHTHLQVLHRTLQQGRALAPGHTMSQTHNTAMPPSELQ